ncbi:MAG: response regulator transcription factor [Actinomycetota bacterium]
MRARKASVLIVDDDEDIRDALHLLFSLDGFDVVGEAADGLEAVRLAESHQPSFVILDYRMPLLNGEATAGLLRASSPGSRIVAFSAVLESKPEWADAYLNKERISDIAPLVERLVDAAG